MTKKQQSNQQYSDLDSLQELKKLRNQGTLFKKLQALKLAYEHGIKNTADFLDVFPVSIRNWAKVINNLEIFILNILRNGYS